MHVPVRWVFVCISVSDKRMAAMGHWTARCVMFLVLSSFGALTLSALCLLTSAMGGFHMTLRACDNHKGACLAGMPGGSDYRVGYLE